MPEQPDEELPTGAFRRVAVDENVGAGSDVSVSVDLSGLSDRGKRRENNEDHFLIARLDRTWHTLQTNVDVGDVPPTSSETVYGMVVADGMGGAAAGEVASRTAIAKFVDLVLGTPDLILRLNQQVTEAALKRFSTRFEQVKEALEDAVVRDPSLHGMGTTMTLACSFGCDLLVAHVGDSRAYLLRDGELRRLTRDQTMGQFLKETGILTEEELARHPLRHVLTGVLGTQGSPIDVDLRGLRLEDQDRILLCTDGLTEMISEQAIAAVLAQDVSAATMCERLVEQALERGGRDNVTVVIGRYRMTTSR